MSAQPVVRALLVGGPMYDGLYDLLPAFTRETGIAVDVVGRLPHPALNAEAALRLPDGGVDLLSTHTKYAPSQAEHLLPLDEFITPGDVEDLVPSIRDLATIDGRLLQLPRLLDVQLLYHRASWFAEPAAREAFERAFKRPLDVPRSWLDLVDVASFLSAPGRAGFLFPGRDSGLFGLFYELLVSAGGDLFTADLQPAFDDAAGQFAIELITELHARRRTTPADLAAWHYDEVSAAFRRGEAAMVCDWPGSDHLYRNESTCRSPDDVALATLPCGFGGRRAAYGGCHSFAVARGARDRAAAIELLRFLTSPEARLREARAGALPVTDDAMDQIAYEAVGDERASRRLELLTDLARHALIIPPRFSRYPACEDALWRALQRAMTGQQPPAVALRAAAEAIAAITKGQRA